MFCSSNQTNFKKALQLYRPKQLVAVIVERALNSLSDHELFYTSRYSANIKQDHDRWSPRETIRHKSQDTASTHDGTKQNLIFQNRISRGSCPCSSPRNGHWHDSLTPRIIQPSITDSIGVNAFLINTNHTSCPQLNKATIRTYLTLQVGRLPPQYCVQQVQLASMNKNMYDRPNHCYLSSSLNLCHSLSFLEEQLRVIPMRAFVLVIQPLLLPDVHKKIDHLLQFHDQGWSNTQYIKMVNWNWNALDLTWRGIGCGNGLFDPSRLSYAAFQLHNK